MKSYACLLSFLCLVASVSAAETASAGLPPPEATEQWTPVPALVATLADGIPSDAVMLFDGKTLEGWESVKGGPAPWKLEDGAVIVVAKSGDIRTKAAFGSVQLHL